jgi:hypothetical protein
MLGPADLTACCILAKLADAFCEFARCGAGFLRAGGFDACTALPRLPSSNFEEADRRLQSIGLTGEFFGGGCHLFGCASVLLDHLIELLDSFVDLGGSRALLAAGGRDFADQFSGLTDIRDEFRQQLACALGCLHAVSRRTVDLGRRGLAAFGELAHFRSHHREAFTVFAGARSLNGGVQRQQIGLACNLFNSMMLIFSATSFIAWTVRSTASPLDLASSATAASFSVCRALSAFC